MFRSSSGPPRRVGSSSTSASPRFRTTETITRRLDRMTHDAEAMLAAYRAARPRRDERRAVVRGDDRPRLPHSSHPSRRGTGAPSASHLLLPLHLGVEVIRRIARVLSCTRDPLRVGTTSTSAARSSSSATIRRNLWRQRCTRRGLPSPATATPGHPGIPTWPAYDPATRGTMAFDEPCAVLHDPGSAERASWDHVL